MFIVDIPGHHGEEMRKRKRIKSGREVETHSPNKTIC